MANNNSSNNNNRGGKNGKNGGFRGVLTLIVWALVLTVAFQYFNAYNNNAANKSTSHEIKYSDMISMIEKDQVEEVLFKDSTIYVTPVDGYVFTEEVTSGSKTETKTYTQSKDSGLTLYTVYLSNADLLPLLEAHNVAYTGFYKAEMSPFLMIMIQYILPTIFIVGAFMLVMRLMSKSGGGGFGGFGGRNPNAPQRGRDIQISINITFEEAAKGCKKTVEVPRVEDCSECGGSGAAKGSEAKTCPDCGGKGYVNVQNRMGFTVVSSQRQCTKCGGRGKIIDNPCPKCGGKGKVRRRKKIEVSVPAGISEDRILTMRGLGDSGFNGGPAGDLKIIVNIKKHPYFTREGYNVWFDKHVSIVEATLGAELEVPTLDGNVKYNMPAGTQPGDVFKLKGKGIQRLNSVGKGDQFVRIIVDIPKNISSEQKNLLMQFDKTYKAPKNSGKEGFFDKFKKK